MASKDKNGSPYLSNGCETQKGLTHSPIDRSRYLARSGMGGKDCSVLTRCARIAVARPEQPEEVATLAPLVLA